MVFTQSEVVERDIICPFTSIPDPAHPGQIISMRCRTFHCACWEWVTDVDNYLPEERRAGFCSLTSYKRESD